MGNPTGQETVFVSLKQVMIMGPSSQLQGIKAVK